MKKRCNICRKSKDLGDFHKKKKGKYGIAAICKNCVSDWMREYHSRPDIKIKLKERDAKKFLCNIDSLSNKDSMRRKRKAGCIKWKYGITLDQYELMLLKQDFMCAICGKKVSESLYSDHNEKCNDTLYIDHDHKDGKIRGLLCNSCNHGLGSFKDDISLFKKAIKYLGRNA